MAEFEKRPTPLDHHKLSKEKLSIPVVKFTDGSRKGLLGMHHEISVVTGKSLEYMLSANTSIDIQSDLFNDDDDFIAFKEVPSLLSEVAFDKNEGIIRNRRGFSPVESEAYMLAMRQDMIADLRKRRSVYKDDINGKTKSIIGNVADYAELFRQGQLPQGERIITSNQTIAAKNEEQERYEVDITGNKIRNEDGTYRKIRERREIVRIAVIKATEDGLQVTDHELYQRDKTLVVFPLIVPASTRTTKINRREKK